MTGVLSRATVSIMIACFLVVGCAVPAATSVPSIPVASPSTSSSPAVAPSARATPDPWAVDLDQLDLEVRSFHPDPFAINPESAWVAKLVELRTSLPTATPEEQLVRLASLIGLLDTHSWIGPPGSLHAYEILFYPFSDGWFVIRATDPTLIGARLVSVGGTPVAVVEATLRPLVPSDNESGELDALEGPMSYVEYLQGAGIVNDPERPRYVLERSDRTTVEVDPRAVPESTWVEALGIVGDLMGDAPEAVARRTEPVWTRLDKKRKTFLFSYNDYTETDLQPAIEAMTAALKDGSADRVVLDMRYLRGGNGSLADPLILALSTNPHLRTSGSLDVLIGRENVSAGTVVAAALDLQTPARFVGEQTPARADNFLCQCRDIRLPNSGFVVSVPTFTFHTGDPRDSIPPDVPMSLASADFFAGRDPVLDAVLEDRVP